jgi:hypothetical protein
MLDKEVDENLMFSVFSDEVSSGECEGDIKAVQFECRFSLIKSLHRHATLLRQDISAKHFVD